jgi:hypothetical protein
LLWLSDLFSIFFRCIRSPSSISFVRDSYAVFYITIFKFSAMNSLQRRERREKRPIICHALIKEKSKRRGSTRSGCEQ